MKDQVRLPLNIAFEVVLQGLRTRLGRSIVTITGVVLGIAFLMSILTGQLALRGVAEEQTMRTEVRRMKNFLMAETGPLRDRVVGIVQTGTLSPVEERFIESIEAEQPKEIRKTDDIGKDATAVLIVGTKPDGVDVQQLLANSRQKVVGTTRTGTLTAGEGVTVVELAREPRPEELVRQQTDAKREQFRSIWIIVISLAVTVIGISNAMLMSVTERFREIGTMKCLGALSSFIRRIFLIESSLVGAIGGVVGTIVGTIFSVVAFSATYGFGTVLGSMDYGLLSLYALGSVVASVVLSIIAALYPATFAAGMVPATALRTNI